MGLITGLASRPMSKAFNNNAPFFAPTLKGPNYYQVDQDDPWALTKPFDHGGLRGAMLAPQEAANAKAFNQKKYLSYLNQSGGDVAAALSGEAINLTNKRDAKGKKLKVGTQDAVTAFQQKYQQYMLDRQRGAQTRQVDAMMSDPRRMGDRTKRMQAERQQGMGDIAEQYRLSQRNNAFNQARRGMQGGSTDVEEQGQIGRARDAAASGLQSGLDAKAQQFRLGDQQQRAQLMGLIYSDDPNTASAFSRTLEGLNQQGQQVQEQSAINRQNAQQQSATSVGYSQGLGGAMSAASKPLEYYLTNRGGGA